MELKNELMKLDACSGARDWVGDKTLSEAWNACERADWMLWYLAKKVDRPRLVGLAAMCAKTVLHIYEQKYPDDKRVRNCIDACMRYSQGKITLEELKKHRDAAVAAVDAAVAFTAAVDAIVDAVDAIDVAFAGIAFAGIVAADVAADVAAVVDVAGAFAADADVFGAKKKHHIKMCDLIRSKIKLKKWNRRA